MTKCFSYCLFFFIVLGFYSCDDESIMKIFFSAEKLVMDENESSKIVTYNIENERDNAEVVFSTSDDEVWSAVHSMDKREVQVKCHVKYSMSDVVGALHANLMTGGKSVTSELTLVKKTSKELIPELFTVIPQTLEVVGGKIPATINGKFPELYFDENAVVEITPVLKWNGGQVKGHSTTFQGEKVQGSNQPIPYKLGGSYTMKTFFDYVPEMNESELFLEFKAAIGKREIIIPAVKVADGVESGLSEISCDILSN